MGSSLLSLSLTTSATTATATTTSTTTTTMTRIFEKRARRSPLLVGTMHKNWDVIGKQKMIRMSIRKLKKLGDPETGKLCKAVLINNTLESVKNSSLLHSCHVQPSHYSSDEERILSNVRLQPAADNLKSVDKEEFSLSSPVIPNLPDPIGPLSDDETRELCLLYKKILTAQIQHSTPTTQVLVIQVNIYYRMKGRFLIVTCPCAVVQIYSSASL